MEGREKTFRKYEDSDFDVLWQAYKEGSFALPEMGKLEFVCWATRTRSRYKEFLIGESNGRPVCFIGVFFDGWKYEPHVEFFSWATSREKLMGSVEYFQRLSKLESVGVVVVKALSESRKLFDRICKYGCLSYVGNIPKGDYRGTEYIYHAAGNAKFPSTTATPSRGI